MTLTKTKEEIKELADMASSSSNGGVPPGFRFHPTEEELLHYYLKKKLSFHKFDMEVIREIDLNKIEPWELQGTYYFLCALLEFRKQSLYLCDITFYPPRLHLWYFIGYVIIVV